MTQILYGNTVASTVKDNLKTKVQQRVEEGKRVPHLAVILVGDDPASQTYVNSKAKQCEQVGFKSTVQHMKTDSTQQEVLDVLEHLNKDDGVDGILVQLPLPKHIHEQTIIEALDPSKDVDGLHPINVGYLEMNQPRFVPCTPKGIMTLLKSYDIELEGKRALVIGRSRLVGKPVSTLLLGANATVTIAHSKTKNLKALIKEHDIIVVAIGKQEMFSAEDFDEHHIVIDVGIHRTESGLRGDVCNDVYDKVTAITPVPKGVGPMTIASLLENTYEAYSQKEAFE
ncbi:bifunctional 5,10-methylene-tetrahydrofolate dehydrogenase/5,10-methylene-tetrahydrofolate cyclohydrolase [Erysipelothrix larvae]|uniref:Bifunctional protein FolD n=1 Tax=Erysipelothrix larvae TaxID=1514105 RepID=A0A0X8GXW4_9FIRM|nr:bifunctional methylenetetrahydrofolate dehydrogenase/methenyltetrahydrofolate cyclohydrolase FolD [Erysipelothrix larvae]AMC92456.1 bifunctional 5,10-methylene-tetrahydrofolate dehydrogenase/5,10-methylene-tetrahydrofolate cyclohydrolase [Erysipelothrix larvae]